MAQPLRPKAKISNTHPLLEHRLAAAKNGWPQNPCTLKEKPCTGWPRMACDENAILYDKEWRNPYWAGTAIRITGAVSLAVYDSDISIPEIADLVLDDFYSINPKAFNAAILRDSGATTQALFFRTDLPFPQYKTHAYTAHPELIPELEAAYALPESTDEEFAVKKLRVKAAKKALEPQKVEIYGPMARARYFQYEGPHSEGREYHCNNGRAPWNTAVDELPLLPFNPSQLMDRADAILAAHLTKIPEAPRSSGPVVYDLKPDTTFIPKGRGRETIEELVAGLEHGAENGIRGCLAATYLASKSESNCKLFITTSGRIAVTDWSNDGQTHYMETDKPTDPVEFDDEARAALNRLRVADDRPQGPPQQPPPPDLGGDFDDAVTWMVQTFCYCKGDLVMPIYDIDPLSAMSVKEFDHRYQMYNRPPDDPRRTALVYASKRWLGHPHRVTVDGFDMRPDQKFPLFSENGKRYKNTYKPPLHEGDGEVETWHQFMKHLLPKEIERETYLDALSYKRQHPAIPGPAIVMVAESEDRPGEEQSGTGRGTLAKILIQLFGWRYAQPVDFEIFAFARTRRREVGRTRQDRTTRGEAALKRWPLHKSSSTASSAYFISATARCTRYATSISLSKQANTSQ